MQIRNLGSREMRLNIISLLSVTESHVYTNCTKVGVSFLLTEIYLSYTKPTQCNMYICPKN